MKKFFTMLMVGMAMCLSFSSCLLVGDVDEIGKVSDLKDSGSELSWSYNAAIAKYTFHYGYEGNTIVYHKDELQFGSILLAKAFYQDLEDNENATINGKIITQTYDASEYENWTVEDVRTLYNDMKEGLNLPDAK